MDLKGFTHIAHGSKNSPLKRSGVEEIVRLLRCSFSSVSAFCRRWCLVLGGDRAGPIQRRGAALFCFRKIDRCALFSGLGQATTLDLRAFSKRPAWSASQLRVSFPKHPLWNVSFSCQVSTRASSCVTPSAAVDSAAWDEAGRSRARDLAFRYPFPVLLPPTLPGKQPVAKRLEGREGQARSEG